MEAIIPTEIGMPTRRTEIPKMANIEALPKDLDMTNELLEETVVRMASYQQRTTNLYNRWVRHCTFQAGDLVLRRIFENTIDPAASKFQPNREGPYTIVRVGPARLYTLDKLNGVPPVSKMLNVMHIKRYYQSQFSLKV